MFEKKIHDTLMSHKKIEGKRGKNYSTPKSSQAKIEEIEFVLMPDKKRKNYTPTNVNKPHFKENSFISTCYIVAHGNKRTKECQTQGSHCFNPFGLKSVVLNFNSLHFLLS